MKHLSKNAAVIFDGIVNRLGDQDMIKINNAPGAYMELVVEKLMEVDFMGSSAEIFSLAHYFEQNGDLVPDPDMTFIRIKLMPMVVLPASFQNQMVYQESLWSDDGKWLRNPFLLSDLVGFANMWLKNIKEQQEL